MAASDPSSVVLVAITVRPYALGLYQARTAAIVQSFFPGEEGGAAIEGILTGRVNPSGMRFPGCPECGLPVGVAQGAMVLIFVLVG